MQRLFVFAFICILFSIPLFVSAQSLSAPLVPCEGPECQACHVVELGNRVISFLIGIASFIAVLVFAWGGFLMVTAAGNTGQVDKAKKMFVSSLVGIVIVLAGWLIVDTVMKWAFDSRDGEPGSPLYEATKSDFGFWNEIRCVPQPELRNPNPGQGRQTVGGGTESQLSVTAAAGRIGSVAKYKDELCSVAEQKGVGGQCAHLQALMAIESNGNPTAVSPVGAVGLMQIMPTTAQTLDPSLRGLSVAEVTERLKNPQYNIELAVELYRRDYNYYNGDFKKVTAAYNGGRGANYASRDCPGMMRWECEWDNRAHTIPNTGYKETRNYVVNVQKVLNQIEQSE